MVVLFLYLTSNSTDNWQICGFIVFNKWMGNRTWVNDTLSKRVLDFMSLEDAIEFCKVEGTLSNN